LDLNLKPGAEGNSSMNLKCVFLSSLAPCGSCRASKIFRPFRQFYIAFETVIVRKEETSKKNHEKGFQKAFIQAVLVKSCGYTVAKKG
jgi:hypothetical protein